MKTLDYFDKSVKIPRRLNILYEAKYGIYIMYLLICYIRKVMKK